MRKIFLYLALAAGVGAFAPSLVRAQTCTPRADACVPPETQEPACIVPLVGAEGYVGEAYEQVFDLNFGRTAETGVPLIPEVYLSRLEIVSIDSMPAGLDVVMFSSNPNDDVHGGNTGSLTPVTEGDALYACGVIHGTPQAPNAVEDSIVIVANAYVKVLIAGEIQGQEIDPNTILPGFNPIRFRYKVPVSEPVSRAEKKADAATLRAFPNPSDGFVRLEWRGQVVGAGLLVRNIEGKVVYQTETTGKTAEIDAAAWPAGVYFAQIESGGARHSTRFVVR